MRIQGSNDRTGSSREYCYSLVLYARRYKAYYRRGNTEEYRQPRAMQSGESRTLNGSKIDVHACKAGNAVSLKFTVVPNFYLDKRYFASSNITHRHVEEALCAIWQRCIASTMGVK